MNFKKFINSDYLKSNPLCGIGTYKDTLDLSNGSASRYVRKTILTGTETISTQKEYYRNSTALFVYRGYTARYSKRGSLNSHFVSITTNPQTTNYESSGFNDAATYSDYYYMRINYSTIGITGNESYANCVNAFKTWLAQQYANGTPVTIYYYVSTPTTETITVPSGLSGTEEGYLNQSGTPTPTNPIYPTANTVEQWFDLNHYIMGTSTDTITTLPAVLYSTGATATVGLKGQTTQSSIPSPTSPVMPQGTGERTGQLIDYTQSESGEIDGSGNYVPADNLWRSTAYTPIDETLQYFVSWTANTNLNVVRINYYTSDKTHISREQIKTSGTALTIPQNAAYLKWTLYAKTDFIIDLSFVHSLQLMINTGSTPLPYEPYGYFIEIEVS